MAALESPQLKRGLLVLNLGTPDSAEVPDVKKYLAQFLMDPFVIDIPRPLRWLLIHGIILQTRPKKSSHAYKSIWTKEGSPLLLNTNRFTDRLREVVGSAYATVQVGMRYGNPSIENALRKMAKDGIQELTVFSLYPQYAESSFRTGIDEVKTVIAKLEKEKTSLSLKVIPPYYGDPNFIAPYAELLEKERQAVVEKVKESSSVYVLMSFHGLPQRHLTRLEIGPERSCGKSESCCAEIKKSNANCYRAQSFETARKMAEKLGLKKEQWGISFQSRLGPGWIQPFTDEVLEKLPSQGKTHLIVVCPSFTSDCLETLEEIGMRGREVFLAAGGKSYVLVPCVNDSPAWVQGAARIIAKRS